MTEVRRAAAVVALSFGIVMLLGVLPAQAGGPPTITKMPVAGTVFTNPCNGEAVTLTSGTFQIVSHVTFDADGGVHVILEGNAMGAVGVGAVTGAKYQATGGFWVEDNIRGPAPFVITGVGVFNLVGQGATPNFVSHETFHITVNANGVVTASFVVGSAECVG